MKKIDVISVNISTETGVIKKPVEQINLNARGIAGDAHSGDWHRQISLLGTESFEKFEKQAKRKIAYGEFAENITVEGVELWKCTPGDLFLNDDIELEVTQIGKKCHGDSCAIYREVGSCVMPKEGIFCKVIRGGVLKAGDKLDYYPQTFTAKVITLSDRAFNEEYSDRSGPLLVKCLESFFEKNSWVFEIEHCLLPDDKEILAEEINEACLAGTDMIFTTGGTGIGPRDITVDTVQEMLQKEIPGIMEHIRIKYGAKAPNALLSRGVAGVRDESLIFTLPGSVKAVNEYMAEIEKVLKHTIFMLRGLDMH